MRLKSTLLLSILLSISSAITAQIRPGWCIQDATISVSGGQSELYFCEGDGIAGQARFKVSPFAQPFAYLVTDENNIILRVSRNNTINFEGLGDGNLRVWAFAYLGNILAEEGQDATNAVLADICFGLTQNFIPVGNIVPDAGSIATADGRSSLFTCRDDGNSDVISFTNTSSDPFYTYVITDEDNIILAFADDDSFDFENLTADKVRVWGVSYLGNINAQIGDNLTSVAFASGCFDLSDNFVGISRAMPDGGTVALATGETNKTICAEDLSGDILTFTSQSTSENPYSFVITDENGVVIAVLNGNTADFTLSESGICRVYGVSFTGELKIVIGDNINNAVLSDDCYDVSDNFVQIIKREVDGGLVSLAGGGTSATVCVEAGQSDMLTFANTSSISDANYVYLVTDQNNVILAISNDPSFNFGPLSGRNLRVWGLSYTGTLLASVGSNAATAALSSECYDLSDNFITITRKSVDGDFISLSNGNTTAAICSGDNAPDTLSFVNSSTSLESYIYLITDLSGNIVGTISGDRFDFATLSQDSFLVYGLSYSGAFTVAVGDNINSAIFSSECADLSGNFVTIVTRTVEGGTVSLEGATDSITFCSGDETADVVTFATNSASTENYIFLITNASNELVNIALDNSFDFENSPTGAYHIWGLSYVGNLLIGDGQNILDTDLSDNCFELSSNFATVNVFETDGGAVSLENGDTSAVVCLNTGQATEFTFANTSTAGNYAFLVTNEANIIVAVTNENSFDFANLSVGNYRVWGVSFAGTLTAQVGQDAAMAALASDCYQLSANFIAISFQQVDGGILSLADGSDVATVCIGDSNTDELGFTTTSTTVNYVFLITDENNTILAISNENNFDFSSLDAAVVRIWGLAFSGNLTAQVGDNAAIATLSEECFDLSDNFITVTRKTVDGATVSLENGDTLSISCAGIPEVAPLTFTNTSAAGSNYAYIVTDETTNVLAIAEGNSFSFDTFPQGTYRVWGLSYTGDLTVQVGDDAILVPLSDECFDLSDNYITVERKDVDGGTISLENGDTTAFVCGTAGTPGVLVFDAETTATNSSYLFVITTLDNDIFAILLGNSVNFNGVRNGQYRVWGVSYTGNPTVRTGQNLFEIPLSTECFEVSDNFILLKKDATTGGTIAAASADTTFTFCPGNGKADVVELSTNGDSSGDYIFILTNANNGFISVIDGESIDFDTLPEGTYQIRGLAYTGNLTLQAGANITNTELSDECFDLSDNFIQVVNQLPDGGTVSLTEGEIQQFTCPADGKADTIAFFNEGNIGAGFVFLITDENNIIEAITEDNIYDFESDTEGINRIWGLAYSGNLTAQIGDNAATAALSDDCFDLSDNFIEIIRELPVGGDVTLQNGDTLTYVCLNTDASSVVKFDSTGTSRGDYIYVITDENNIIRNGIFGDEFDFSFLSLGKFRVWGLAYTGTLTATIGDVVTDVPISDDCFELSDTYATVVISDADGATVATESGAAAVTICVGDGEADVIAFDSTSTALGSYSYLITDKNNLLLAIAEGDSFDFENIDTDTCRVWGLSYLGALQAQIGEDITAATLAEGCFDLSDNFVLINRALVDGGRIASDPESDVIYTCVGDGIADLVLFSNSSTANANYIYVLTNENNLIRGTVNGNQFDFETAGVGVTRIWGVSFTGTFTGAFNANILTAAIATGCFQVSENFITVSRDSPFGGDISIEGGGTSTFFCPSPSEPGLVFETTSNRRLQYAFVVTDTNNVVVAFSNRDTVDFASLPVGTYRVWGLSFAGISQLEIGENILGSDPLASSCFEISSNFVTVYRSTLVDGGRIDNLEGPDTLYVCPGNESEDLVILENDSEANEAGYVYALTNENNIVLIPSLSSEVVDFNNATPGVYRIWGVSFTGEYSATASDNITSAQLSDSCYQASENFITIIVDTPNGGTVATTDSLTFIEPNLDLGEPELFSFMSNDASIVKYQYVVTNVNNEIVAFIDSIDVDFEGLASWGTLRVWGLAYTGTIKVGVGEDLDSGDPLTNDCYDLSDNFVLVAFPVPATGDDAPIFQYETPIATVVESYSQMKVEVAPNPASHRIRVNINAERPQIEQSNLRIYSLTGQLMYEQNLLIKKGDNQVEVRISDLPDGLYLLQLRNGDKIQTVRFLKQWQ